MAIKQWIMAFAAIIGFGCLLFSLFRGDGVVVVLSFVIAIVPAVIWFSDYKESQKVQQDVTNLKGWRADINTEYTDNPEWVHVITDAEDRILFGIKKMVLLNGAQEFQSQ